jgi:hypothetical protein
MKKYIFLIVCLLGINLSAQSVLTGYHSNSFMLQSSANASVFPEANFVLGFPGLSTLSYSLQWPLSLNELFEKGSDDSLRLSLPLLNSNLLEHNLLSTSFRNQLFQIGFKVGVKKNIFVYAGDELVVDAGMQFSDKFMSYLTQGNANFLNQQMDFNSEKVEITSYNSFYIGSALKVNEELEVGARVKFLKGIANIHTNKFKLGFYTDSTASPVFATTLNADVLLQTSGQGAVNDTIDFDVMLNNGFAIDLGASYKFTEQLSASFAINDIGSIKWAEYNNALYTTDGEVDFVFTGLTQSSSGAEDLQAQMEEISDSLMSIMEPKEIKGSYKTKLNPSLYLGVSYDLNDKHHFSGLYHRKQNIAKAMNVFSLGYQFQLAKSLQLLASCQTIGGVGAIGTGFVWSPSLLQMHFVLDNILVTDVFDAKNFFLQMGLSFHFGRIKY